MELSQARSKLQAAIDESHPAPPAKYLRASAAACLLYGLQSVPLGFRMNAVLCTQVTSHVQAECPDKPDVLQRLQNSKYFEVIGLPGLPDQFLLDLHAIIMPHQLPQVTDILASMNPIHPQPHEPPQTKTSPDPPESTQLTVPLQVVEDAKAVLQTAVVRSHGSHTATWLRETAAACIDMGLKPSVSGLQMRPVTYQLLATRMQRLFQGPNELLVKLQSISGQKYFTLLGPVQNPVAVSLDLSSIIHPPGRTADVDRLVRRIKVITEHRSSTNVSKPILPPPGYPTSTQPCTNDSMPNKGTMDVVGARKQLKAAILKSHPPTARYLVEAAAICLDYCLQAAPSQGCTLKPVAWGLVVTAVTSRCPGTYNLSDKLCGSVGQKYFRLLGSSPAGWPELVAAKLDSLITSPHRPPVAQLLACISSAADSTQLYQSSLPSQPLADASMTESRAKQMLRAAIQTEHAGSQESAKFIRAMGCAVVEIGLRTRGSFGFKLAPVTFTSVGVAIAAVKQNSRLATSNTTAIIADLHLQQYFSYVADAKSEKHLTMHIAHVLPHADATIQSLLPDVTWRHRGPSPSAADHIVIVPVQKGQATTLTATQKQSTIPAPLPVGMPSAPHTPTALDKPPVAEQEAKHKSNTSPGSGFTVKIGGMSAVAVICVYEECSTSAADLLSSVHVRSVEGCCTFDMKQQQVELEMQGFHTLLHNNNVVKVVHDCRQAAAALFFQENITICNVFDTQVAQGVLDHTNSVLGTLQYQRRRNLKDLLSLYNIAAPHPGTSQGVEAAAQDGADLLLLAKELNGLLGTSGQAIVYKLSQAQCQWNYMPADRCSTQPNDFPNSQEQPLQLSEAQQEPFEDGYPGDQNSDSSNNKFLLTLAQDVVPAAEADADSDTMQSILSVLPEAVRDAVTEHLQSRKALDVKLAEIVAVKGKPVSLWFTDHSVQELPVHLDIALAVSKLSKAASCGDAADSDPFNAENRMGLDGTLHRISAIRGRDQQQSITGLTYRIGWHISGIADQLLDVLSELQSECSGKLEGACHSSLLLLGPPGAGKTTLLRDIVSNLATRFDKRVVVVDTWNEVGGDGAVPHACLGTARRLHVPDHSNQHKVMLQAMQTYNPEVIVVDEISSIEEVQAIISIAQHGVIVVASAPDPSLKSLIGNSELNALVGRSQHVACGDMHTKDLANTLSIRQGVPLFKILVEVFAHDKWHIHQDVAASIDALLAGRQTVTQLRPHHNGKLVIHVNKAAADMPDSNLQETDPFWLMRLGRLANQMADAASPPSAD